MNYANILVIKFDVFFFCFSVWFFPERVMSIVVDFMTFLLNFDAVAVML